MPSCRPGRAVPSVSVTGASVSWNDRYLKPSRQVQPDRAVALVGERHQSAGVGRRARPPPTPQTWPRSRRTARRRRLRRRWTSEACGVRRTSRSSRGGDVDHLNLVTSASPGQPRPDRFCHSPAGSRRRPDHCVRDPSGGCAARGCRHAVRRTRDGRPGRVRRRARTRDRGVTLRAVRGRVRAARAGRHRLRRPGAGHRRLLLRGPRPRRHQLLVALAPGRARSRRRLLGVGLQPPRERLLRRLVRDPRPGGDHPRHLARGRRGRPQRLRPAERRHPGRLRAADAVARRAPGRRGRPAVRAVARHRRTPCRRASSPHSPRSTASPTSRRPAGTSRTSTTGSTSPLPATASSATVWPTRSPRSPEGLPR